jgi:single-stranded-DNA-specific exonuclease
VEEYKRPVFLWGREEGATIKGSCRSDGSVNVVDVMKRAADSFIEFGGHAFSGGFSVKDDAIHTLEAALIDGYQHAERASIDAALVVDAHLSLSDVCFETFRNIAQLAPLGEGNPKPVFLFEHVTIDDVRIFGKGKEHLELRLRDSRGDTVTAIGFFMRPDQFDARVEVGNIINLIATMEQSTFRGRRSIQLRIIDIG